MLVQVSVGVTVSWRWRKPGEQQETGRAPGGAFTFEMQVTHPGGQGEEVTAWCQSHKRGQGRNIHVVGQIEHFKPGD